MGFLVMKSIAIEIFISCVLLSNIINPIIINIAPTLDYHMYNIHFSLFINTNSLFSCEVIFSLQIFHNIIKSYYYIRGNKHA